MRAVFLIPAFLLASPALADIRDVRVAASGERALVVVETDAPAHGVTAQPTPGGFALDLPGLKVTPRKIDPAMQGLVTAVLIEAIEGGARVTVSTAVETLAARAHVEDALTVVDLTLAAPAPAARRGEPETWTAPPAKPEPAAPKPEDGPPQAAPTIDVAVAKEGPVTLAAVEGAESEAAAALAPEREGEPAGSPRAAELIAAELSEEDCEAAEAAVRADPWALDLMSDFGACLAREGRTEEARAVFARLLTFEPASAMAHLGLGAAKERLGDIEGARLHYQEGLELSRSDAGAARARVLLEGLPPQE